jgi:hypothetical protein
MPENIEMNMKRWRNRLSLPAKPQPGQATFCPFSIANSRSFFAS